MAQLHAGRRAHVVKSCNARAQGVPKLSFKGHAVLLEEASTVTIRTGRVSNPDSQRLR
jgi:hypothetical protein